ncbi:MAG: HEPN domain-containing protein [Muribaculaceae bacterium]|nr:HEPN domain-containing protein [Muribaculaceae bacterium]
MTLLSSEKEAILEYRIERAYQALKEAKDNASLGNWNLSVNRLYYAVFYMALAVNLNNGDSARTHNGVYSLFCKRYVAADVLSREDGVLYRRLFSMRQSGDYDDMFDWVQEDVMPLIPKTESLINSMRKLII